MRLTLHTDYALRVLLYLGLEPERVTPVDEIARAYGISRHHLDKVARRLVRLGFVDALRGRSGGLRLAMPAPAIVLGAVVRGAEPDMDLVECFDDAKNTCPIAGQCGLESVLRQAREAFLAVLDRYTLADLLRERGGLAHTLGLVPLGAA